MSLKQKKITSAEFLMTRIFLSHSALFNEEIFCVLEYELTGEPSGNALLLQEQMDKQTVYRKRKLFIEEMNKVLASFNVFLPENYSVVGLGSSSELNTESNKISFGEIVEKRLNAVFLEQEIGLKESDYNQVMALFKNGRKKDSIATVMRSFLEGKKLAEIGSVLGMSRQGVHIYQKAFAEQWKTLKRIYHELTIINQQLSGDLVFEFKLFKK